MTRSELYNDILPKLVDYLFSLGTITEAEKDTINEYRTTNGFEEACDELMGIPAASNFKKIVKAMHDLTGEDEIKYPLPVRHYTVEEQNKERLVAFSYKTSDIAVMPVVTIKKEVEKTTVPSIDSTCFKIIELICLHYKDNTAQLSYLWECINGQHNDDYFLLTTEPETPAKNWQIYSYGYLCFVNTTRFEMPVELEFDSTRKFKDTIAYNAATNYEQYFDAYNVMSESKYAGDVLMRYLRMYQLLEYMAYRRALADLTKGNIKENGFVRNVISKASKGSTQEFDELKKGLKDVLPDISTLITPAEIDTDKADFIKNRLMIKNTNHDNAKFWEVIYQLRNSIVHNKESELHFMYANTKVYQHGIALMKLLIKKIEPAIVDVINDPANNYLEFTEQKVQVY